MRLEGVDAYAFYIVLLQLTLLNRQAFLAVKRKWKTVIVGSMTH